MRKAYKSPALLKVGGGRMKLRIIGPSGSGKTYLAEALSGRLGIPAYDLDGILWDNSGMRSGIKRDAAERDALFSGLVGRDDWIIEGVQYSWTGRSFSDADGIILLDPPRLLCRIRIVRRFLKRKFKRSSRRNESLDSVVKLLKWTGKFYRVNLPEIREALEPYSQKTIELKTKKEIRAFLVRAKEEKWPQARNT